MRAMPSAVWTHALDASADPPRARHHYQLLAATAARETLAGMDARSARALAALLGGSEALSALLVAHPDWLETLTANDLRSAPSLPRRRGELHSALAPALAQDDYAAASAVVRQFKQREMLRIATRDLARLATLETIVGEISDVADLCLAAVWQICRQQLGARYGQPYHQDATGHWHRTQACVLGMGKLGGQELNYSSDVDLLFVYDEEGLVLPEAPRPDVIPPAALNNHQFFNKLAETFIGTVTRLTADGALYRVDLRLRPEGDAGALARSLTSYENYYTQWGQTWERMMLIKARGVAGDPALAAEFLETIQPFRYPRSVNESVLDEVAAMKTRIEQEVVKAGELDRNVKLGRGGIREIEFIVQAHQLLRGGRQPFLQNPQTLPTLDKLAQYDLLSVTEVRQLQGAYCFLRDVEHRLQMESNRQTHSIPVDRRARQRLAALMDFPSLQAFETRRATHTRNVRRVYDKFLKGGPPRRALPFPVEFQGEEAAWKTFLAARQFRDVDQALRMLREFVKGPGYVHVSPRTADQARQLLQRLFARCPGGQPLSVAPHPTSSRRGRAPTSQRRRASAAKTGSSPRALLPERVVLSDPDRVVTRLDSFINAYGARATLFEIWHGNPSLFDLLVLLFDRSEFLAEVAIRAPDLIDEQVAHGYIQRRRTAAETLADLRHGLRDEDQHAWLRRYHQAEQMRVGLRDILGLADPEQYLTELSALAEACLQYALESVMRQHGWTAAPLAIIGLGKLGGAEIDYGSDLDVLFVTDAPTRELTRLQQASLDLMDLLSRRTEHGVVFQMDARLRPDGDAGLLVNTVSAYEEYYRRRAQLWEIQAISRARFIAGNAAVGEQFQRLAAALTDFRPANVAAEFGLATTATSRAPSTSTAPRTKPHRQARGGSAGGLAAYSSDWKQKIHQMRMRIEKERTPSGQDELAIKTGQGGLVDVEFIAQALCLEHGWQEANTVRALERARRRKLLPGADQLIANYRRLRRVEGILRRWSYEGETVLPEDPAPYYRVAVRCGFQTPEAFREALAAWRAAVREVYQQYFGLE